MKKFLNFVLFDALGIVLILVVSSCASFKGDIPLSSMIPDEVYMSPMNQDGIKDSFVMDVDIPDTKGLKLAGYNISVISETNEVVYIINAGQVMPKGEKSIPGKKTALVFPEQIIWNGTDQNGEWVGDGLYLMKISAWDYIGNKGLLEPIKIIIDNTAPEAETILPYLIFSPNNDGNQEILDLYQTSSSEDEWLAEFIDADNNTVKTITWNGLVQDFQWDGTDDSGNRLDDNSFVYKLSSTDRAGNSYENIIEGLVIETKTYAISVNNNVPAFSPNRDGILETVSFLLETDKADQINQMSFLVVDEAGEVRRDLTPANKTFPKNVLFDGRDKNGKFLPEGHYYGVFSVIYKNGNNPVVTSSSVLLDVTPPSAVITRNYRIFSPDGDGKKDEVEINVSTSDELLWEGIISNAAGNAVRSYEWSERAIAFNWNGEDDLGNPVLDGEYMFQIKSTDLAGTTASYQSQTFIVDTQATPVTVKSKTMAFSPNGDGIEDMIEFELNPSIKEGIINWDYVISDAKGNAVYNFGLDSLNGFPETLAWQGTNKSGEYVEGKFMGTLQVEYEKGNQVETVLENPFVLDLTPPAIVHSMSSLPFSPDKDGISDLLRITVNVTDEMGVKNWSASIMDPTGQLFLRIPSNQFKNNVFVWNGLSAKNELVQSASDYTLVINAEDSVGNTAAVKDTIPIDILVLKDGANFKISVSSINFKPFTADYLDLSPLMKSRNIATLDRLAVILQKYSTYNIQLEGHAVRILWDRPDKWLVEENDTLLPLSSLRAESIRDALILRGIDGARMTTTGRGGYDPLVPHSDLINRWKNRRVEFILIK